MIDTTNFQWRRLHTISFLPWIIQYAMIFISLAAKPSDMMLGSIHNIKEHVRVANTSMTSCSL